MYHQMMAAIGESLSNIACSDGGEDGDDENDDETEQGQQSKDDEASWVLGKITKTVLHFMEKFLLKQMRFDELTQMGCENAADYIRERDKKYGTSELMVAAVNQLQMDDNAAPAAPATCGELIVCLDIFSGITQMLQGTLQPGSGHMRLCSGKLQSNRGIPGRPPSMEPDTSPLQNGKSVELISVYPCR